MTSGQDLDDLDRDLPHVCLASPFRGPETAAKTKQNENSGLANRILNTGTVV